MTSGAEREKNGVKLIIAVMIVKTFPLVPELQKIQGKVGPGFQQDLWAN